MPDCVIMQDRQAVGADADLTELLSYSVKPPA